MTKQLERKLTRKVSHRMLDTSQNQNRSNSMTSLSESSIEDDDDLSKSHLSVASHNQQKQVQMTVKEERPSIKELAKTLTLDYNKARQAAITQEILEVAGGAAAVG